MEELSEAYWVVSENSLYRSEGPTLRHTALYFGERNTRPPNSALPFFANCLPQSGTSSPVQAAVRHTLSNEKLTIIISVTIAYSKKTCITAYLKKARLNKKCVFNY
jgi:hypothetical protein